MGVLTAVAPSATGRVVVLSDFNDSITFYRVDDDHRMDQPYYLRVEANRDLSEDDALRLAALVGYAWRATIAGEPLDPYHRDGDRAVWFYADSTKSRRDDVGIAFEQFEEMIARIVAEGSPVRTTNRAGVGTRGTRLVDGLGEGAEVSIWVDSVFPQWNEPAVEPVVALAQPAPVVVTSTPSESSASSPFRIGATFDFVGISGSQMPTAQKIEIIEMNVTGSLTVRVDDLILLAISYADASAMVRDGVWVTR